MLYGRVGIRGPWLQSLPILGASYRSRMFMRVSVSSQEMQRAPGRENKYSFRIWEKIKTFCFASGCTYTRSPHKPGSL
jgi:hypothetical protein